MIIYSLRNFSSLFCHTHTDTKKAINRKVLCVAVFRWWGEGERLHFYKLNRQTRKWNVLMERQLGANHRQMEEEMITDPSFVNL